MKVPSPVYGAVPPVAETVTVVVPPLQRIAAPCEDDADNAVGSLIVIDAVVEQPLASVTVYV